MANVPSTKKILHVENPAPPWLDDPEPHLWVSPTIAARIWFKSSAEAVRDACREGRIQFPTYRAGENQHARWFIRLPRLSKA